MRIEVFILLKKKQMPFIQYVVMMKNNCYYSKHSSFDHLNDCSEINGQGNNLFFTKLGTIQSSPVEIFVRKCYW